MLYGNCEAADGAGLILVSPAVAGESEAGILAVWGGEYQKARGSADFVMSEA